MHSVAEIDHRQLAHQKRDDERFEQIINQSLAELLIGGFIRDHHFLPSSR
jgi:hypothetical protein